MTPQFPIALQLAGVGLLLVFGAILLLWGGMALLARATAPRPSPPHLEDPEEERRRTAAAATALAWLRRGERHDFPLPPTALVSAWQAVMRAAQLRQRGPVR